MITQKFRKKPVVIEAMQYDGSSVTATPIIAWALGEGGSVTYYCEDGESCRRDSHVLRVATLKGAVTALPGDWIIRGVKGEFYPCKPDIFAATYEAADQ